MVNPKIHTKDWNILVVLDACRYDYFQQMNSFEGQLTKVKTGESCTQDWFRKNFTEKYPYIYISGSPWCAQKDKVYEFLGGKHFKRVIDVWKFGWNPKYNTVLPGMITSASIPYLSEEKVILHYMQPHHPGIGKTQDKLLGWNPNNPPPFPVKGGGGHYRAISLEEWKVAYVENLEIVFHELKNLFEYVPKGQKIMVTSDHGETLGERRMRGHPCNTIIPVLCDVPWFEVEQ